MRALIETPVKLFHMLFDSLEVVYPHIKTAGGDIATELVQVLEISQSGGLFADSLNWKPQFSTDAH